MFNNDSDQGFSVGLKIAEKAAPNRSLCPSLSLKTRVYGWLTCFVLGYIISLASCGMIVRVATNPIKFAVLYTLGTIVALASSCFLWGPMAQIKSMFDKKRWLTSTVFVGSIIGVILCAVFNSKAAEQGFTKMWVIILALVLVQFCAYFWLCISYIPYGQKIFCKCCKKCFDD